MTERQHSRDLRRAARLLRLYPPAWRERYGDEFAEVLLADMQDRPHSARRTADVVLAGASARLRSAGLSAEIDTTDPTVRRVRQHAGLAAFAGLASVFVTFGITLWSQVVVGWRWEPPSSPAVTVGMALMSGGLAVMVLLAVLAATPVMWTLMKGVRLARRDRLARPGLLLVAGMSVLILGSVHYASTWPGTGGHHWSHRGVVPPGVAALAWAATRGVTAYWAHPGALGRFDLAEVVWMGGSLVAAAAAVTGTTTIIRRLRLSDRALRFEAGLGRAMIAAMGVFLAGAACWVVADVPPGPTGIYRVGAIDVAGVIVMAITLASSRRAVAAAR